MKLAIILLSLATLGFGQSTCESAFRSVEQTGIPMTGIASGTNTFIDVVKGSEVGKILAKCPNLADRAYDFILKSGHDAIKQLASYRTTERVGILLTIFDEKLSARNLARLKSFLRLRPWEHGFEPFAASIAVDNLLAHYKDPAQDTGYHHYDQKEMEAALAKYVR